jgi:phospholipase/lecithinase/hemolysin
LTVLLGVLAVLAPRAEAWAGPPIGIGVLGDSYSDEYRFYPPDRSRARNWVEILVEVRGLNFGRFTTEPRGEPRNQGYEFNWARSDATTSDLIATGQHTGLAAQVARGEVSVVVIFIGGNDFIYALAANHPPAELDRVLARATANLQVALETILKASSRVCILLATLPDILELPEFAAPLRAGKISPSVATAYRNAIGGYNHGIRLTALRRKQVILLDLALLAQLASRPHRDTILVSGQVLDRIRPSNRPGHVFLADSRHAGTAVHAVMANLVIHTLNARLDARIEPLTPRNLLDLAEPPPPVVVRGSR